MNFFHDVKLMLIFPVMALGFIITLNFVWAILRMMMRGPAPYAVRLLAARMSVCLHQHQPVDLALEGMSALLPWPLPQRLRKAGAQLRSDSPMTLVDTLDAHRLLPGMLVPLAKSAERLGPSVLEQWFRSLSQSQIGQDSLRKRLAPTLLTLFAIFGTIFFLAVLVIPKYKSIFSELDIHVPAIAWLAHISAWCDVLGALGLTLITIVPLSVAIACWARWRWLLERRLLRAQIILSAICSGNSESAIASALHMNLGETSVAGLCHRAGWAVEDADQLAIALDAAQQRRQRHRLILISCIEILAPIVLAVPVLIIGRTIFGLLITIIHSVET